MDKIDQLLDAIEHPEQYSDSELEALLSDPEVQEALELMGKTKSSLRPISSPDVDAEWASFAKAHKKQRLITFRPFNRNIAASIAIVIASLAAVAALINISVSRSSSRQIDTSSIVSDMEDSKTPAVISESVSTTNDTVMTTTEPDIVLFDNEPFESIISRIASYYGSNALFKTEQAKSLRLYFKWDRNKPLETIIESLNNFEQIHLSIDGQTIEID